MSSEKPLFFKNQARFREWLQNHHGKESELWVGYYKKHTGMASITWPGSVDEGLCFGWIDGIRKSIDDKRYKIRFTPRNSDSHWSHVNIKRIEQLLQSGLVMPAGQAAFSKRTEENTGKAPHEQAKVVLAQKYKKLIRSNKPAWEYYNNLPPSTRKRYDWWIMNAKQEKTRQRRIGVLIDSSAKGELIPAMVWGKRKK